MLQGSQPERQEGRAGALAFLVVGAITFGFSSVLIKLCAFPPGMVGALRLLAAGLAVLPFAVPGIRTLVRTRGIGRTLPVLVPGLLLGLHFQLWVTGVRMTTVAAATFIFATNPVLFAVAELAIYRRRLAATDWVALALVIGGGAWLLAANRGGLGGGSLAGDLLCALATVAFALYLIVSERVSAGVPHAPYLALIYIAGGIATLPVALARGEAPGFSWGNGGAWVALAALALLPTLVGHASNTYGVRFFAPILVSFFSLLEPILSSVAALVVLGEQPVAREYPAYALFAAATAVFLTTRWLRMRVSPAPRGAP